MLLRVLVVTESAALTARVARLLAGADTVVTTADGDEVLWQRLATDSFDLVVVSEKVVPEPKASVVTTIRRLPDRPDLVVLQEREEAARRATLLSAGCLAVLNVGIGDGLLGETLRALAGRRREMAVRELSVGGDQAPRALADFASRSQSMRRLLDTARRVADADSSLLVLGETGVGKEWLARAIHDEGPRRHATFLAVNCAAIPESLLESELFGHEKGAFTGAARPRRGYFELAHGGTLFLDEIGEMPPHLQAKLLRVLEERRVTRLGAERSQAVDVRIMAATNRDPDEAMSSKALRPDLYFRLSVVTLSVPPLRARQEDVEPLVMFYLDHFRTQLGRPIHGIRSEVLEALRSYLWPGNVRELINVVERAVLLCRGETITLEEIPGAIAAAITAGRGAAASRPMPGEAGVPTGPLGRTLREVRARAVELAERSYLEALLAETGGRIGETARRAGIDPRSLYDKMRRHGLRKEDYRLSSGGA